MSLSVKASMRSEGAPKEHERLGKPLARVFGALQVTRSQHFKPTLKRTLKTQGIPHKSMRV